MKIRIMRPTFRFQVTPARRRFIKCGVECVGLALFMVILSSAGVLLEHPGSPCNQAIGSAVLRRVIMGLIAGGWIISLCYSSWGQHSGAHINPAVSLAMYRMGRLNFKDTLFYIIAQFIGAWFGMLIAEGVLGSFLAEPEVAFITTTPGETQMGLAFMAEAVLAFLVMGSIIFTSDKPGWRRYSGLCVGLLIMVLIIVAAPISGLSLNPARTLGPALVARSYQGLWIYMIAPPLGMLAAVEVLRRRDVRRALALKAPAKRTPPLL